MMNRAFSMVLTTLLVVCIFMMGMFYSFTAGGISVAQDCDMFNAFYSHGRLYVCVPAKKKLVVINPTTKAQPRPQIY